VLAFCVKEGIAFADMCHQRLLHARRSSGFVSQPVLAAAPFNWRKVLASRPHVPPFLSEFAAEAAAAAEGAAPPRAAAGGAAGAFAGLSAVERQQRLMGEVSAVITNLLGTGASNINLLSMISIISSTCVAWLHMHRCVAAVCLVLG
jgi:hypothetical protein